VNLAEEVSECRRIFCFFINDHVKRITGRTQILSSDDEHTDTKHIVQFMTLDNFMSLRL
jgi:hypothetical protein